MKISIEESKTNSKYVNVYISYNGSSTSIIDLSKDVIGDRIQRWYDLNVRKIEGE